MGTCPWANDQNGRRPDHSLSMLPISTLGHDPYTDGVSPQMKVSRMSCRVNKSLWDEGKEEVHPLDPVFPTRLVNRILLARIRVGKFFAICVSFG